MVALMALMNVFAGNKLRRRQCSERFNWPNCDWKSNFALFLIVFVGHHLQHSPFRVLDAG